MKIAFGYKMRSGKDTCAKYLIDKYGGEKISFSKFVYDIMYYAQSICGLKTEKDRKFLQWIGTEWGRKQDPDLWLNLTMKDISETYKNYETCENENVNLYCTDVRFINEFQRLKKEGWHMIKIHRDMSESVETSHISECELDSVNDDEWDFVIANNGSLKKLYNKLDEIIKKIN